MVAILRLLPSNIHENAMNRTSTCMLHLAPLFYFASSRHPAWPQLVRERRRRSGCLMSRRHVSRRPWRGASRWEWRSFSATNAASHRSSSRPNCSRERVDNVLKGIKKQTRDNK